MRLRGIFRGSRLGTAEEFAGGIGIILIDLQAEPTNCDPGKHASHVVVEEYGLDAGVIKDALRDLGLGKKSVVADGDEVRIGHAGRYYYGNLRRSLFRCLGVPATLFLLQPILQSSAKVGNAAEFQHHLTCSRYTDFRGFP